MKLRKQKNASDMPLITHADDTVWDDVDVPKHGSVLRKLNCGSNKKLLQKQAEMDRYGGGGGGGRGATMMRPVVITVKDGDMPYRRGSTNEPTETLEFKSTFLVGHSARGTTSPPRIRKVTPEKQLRFEKQTRWKSPERTSSKSPERKSKSSWLPSSPMRRQNNGYTESEYTPQQQQQQKAYSPSKHSPNRRSLEMDDIRTEKEKERRNRWFKGVVRSWKDDADLGTAFGEESTYATNSCYTESSGYSYSDDDTYSYESSRLGGRGGGGRSRHHHQRHNSYSNSRDLSQPIFSSVAQDLGVVAQMILSDGAACISSAAEITKESIANCRTQDMRY